MVSRSGTYNIAVEFDAAKAGRGVRDINTGMGEMHDRAKKVAEFFAGTLKTFANFEQAMAEVKAISGATGEEFQQLTDRAREMGRVTVFTAQESAEALKFISMAGIEAKDAVVILPDILNLAAAGALDLGKAADLATNIMTVFGREASDMTNITDILAHTAASSNTNIQQLASAISYAGPIARAAGMTMEELAAAVGMLGNAGIQGYRAGTGLRSMITSLVKPTKMARDTFESLGIKITDSAGNMRSALDLIGDLTEVGASASDLAKIFTSRSVPAVKALMNAMEAGELDPFIQSMHDVDGAAKKMADTMLDTTKGSVTLLKSKLTDLALTIGESLAPVLNHILDHLNKFVGWIGKAAEAHPKLFTAISVVVGVLAVLVTGITGVGVALAGLGIAMPLVATGFAGVATAATAAWIAITGPVGLVVAAIAALAAVVGVVLFKAWKGNSEALKPVKELMKAVVEVAKALWERIKQLWNEGVKPLVSAFIELGKVLAPVIIPVVKVLIALFSTQLKVAFTVITGVLKILAALIRGDFIGAWNALKNVVIGVAKNIITGIKSILKALPDKFIPDGWIRSIEKAETYLENAMNNMGKKSDETNQKMQTGIGNTSMEMKHQFGEIENAGTQSLTAIDDKSGELSGAMSEDADSAAASYTAAGQTIQTEMSGNLDAAKAKTGELANASQESGSKIGGYFKALGGTIKDYFISRINTAKENIKTVSTVVGTVVNFMKERFKVGAQQIGIAVSNGVKVAKTALGFLKTGVENVKTVLGGIRDAAQRGFQGIVGQVGPAKAAIEGLKGVVERVKQSFQGLITAAKNAANKAKGWLQQGWNRLTGQGGGGSGSGGGNQGGGNRQPSGPRAWSKRQARDHAYDTGLGMGARFRGPVNEWQVTGIYGVGVHKGKASSVTKLAEGGIVKARPGGTPAIIGEGGQDEAVIPLDRMGSGSSMSDYYLREILKYIKMNGSPTVMIGDRQLDDVTFNSNIRNDNINRTQRNNPWT